MTTPTERYLALAHTRQFILQIMDNVELPTELRETAFRLVKHYPSRFYLNELAEVAPQLLEITDETCDRI